MVVTVELSRLAESLESLYERYNRREYVHPDPLEFLYRYEDPFDVEVVGLIASSLAYGRVQQILKSISLLLDRIESPHKYISRATRDSLEKNFSDFRHRFTTGAELAALLYGAGRIIRLHGSIGRFMVSEFSAEKETITPALSAFVKEMETEAGGSFYHLLPDPCRKSACKRLNLYLRWMVRRDEVDPGIWYNISPSHLVVPLDIHMYRICCQLGLTERRQADMATAMEITRAFRSIRPDDPARYDFALTRHGIRSELNYCSIL